MADQKAFVAKLALIAEMAGRQISADLIVMYVRTLTDLGFPALCAALDRVALERGDRDPFPSIRTIRNLVTPEANTDHEALDASNRIVEALSKFGWTMPLDAESFIGPLGWMVVQREGGWQTICTNVMADQIPTLKAQWRELAKALQGRAKRGDLHIAPRLPEKANGLVQKLTATLALNKPVLSGRDRATGEKPDDF